MAKTRLKFEQRKSTLADAVSTAYGELTSLAEEVREIVDNASEGLSQTQRIQTLGETADTLEGLNEPDVPAGFADLAVSYHEQVPNRKGRGLSRASRRDNATIILDESINALQAIVDDEGAKEQHEDAQEVIEELERLKDEADGCEFPGMYG